MLGSDVRARPRGVAIKYIWGTSLKNNEVSAAVYRDFLPSALADGRYAAIPPPHIVRNGLEHLQHALDVQRRGVSAAKVVVTLTPSVRARERIKIWPGRREWQTPVAEEPVSASPLAAST